MRRAQFKGDNRIIEIDDAFEGDGGNKVVRLVVMLLLGCSRVEINGRTMEMDD